MTSLWWACDWILRVVLPWRWRHQTPLQRWYSFVGLHVVMCVLINTTYKHSWGVFSTVHHSIELFHLPTLIYNSLFINNMYSYTTILDMFRALTCPSSGGPILFSQHLVTSLSVNGYTIHWLRAVYCAAVYRERRYQMLWEYNWSSWRWAC
jgi:hypothetical protein